MPYVADWEAQLVFLSLGWSIKVQEEGLIDPHQGDASCGSHRDVHLDVEEKPWMLVLKGPGVLKQTRQWRSTVCAGVGPLKIL